MCALVELLENEDGTLSLWGAALARLELGILTELGYGLDLSECAASGVRENLTYVSPKSGRAVCADAGAPYSDKLLPLPAFLLSRDGLMPNITDAYNSLKLTGYFLERNIWIVSGKGQPAARERLLSALYTASH